MIKIQSIFKVFCLRMQHFQCEIVKMCGRTCVGVTGGKTARTHALRTHVLEVISHAHAHVRPHIALVRVRTNLRNSSLESLGNKMFGMGCLCS